MLKTRLPCQHKNSGISGCHIKILRGNSKRKRWVGGEDIHLPICQLLTITFRDQAAFFRLGGLNKMPKALLARAAGAKCPRGVRGHAPPENV